CQQESSWPWTF
nr:immunoglobulin light chain junction region [Macaca mulatta]